MSKPEIKMTLNRLESIVRRMDVPSYKVRNVAWLNKNLSVRNQNHPDFGVARDLISQLISVGVSHG